MSQANMGQTSMGQGNMCQGMGMGMGMGMGGMYQSGMGHGGMSQGYQLEHGEHPTLSQAALQQAAIGLGGSAMFASAGPPLVGGRELVTCHWEQTPADSPSRCREDLGDARPIFSRGKCLM